MTYSRQDYEDTISVRWFIDTDDPSQGPLSVEYQAELLEDNPLPPYFSMYDSDALFPLNTSAGQIREAHGGLFLRSRNMQRSAAKNTLWICEGEYGRFPDGSSGSDSGGNPGENTLNPLDRAVRYSIEIENETVPIDEAWSVDGIAPFSDWAVEIDGKTPLINAAGRTHDEQLYEDRTTFVLKQQWNEPDLDNVIRLSRFDLSLNYETWHIGPNLSRPPKENEAQLTIPQDHAKYLSCDAGEQQTHSLATIGGQATGEITFYVCTLRVAVSQKPFYRSILNHGLVYVPVGKGWNEAEHFEVINPSTGEKQPALEPAPLDSTGDKLPENANGNFIRYRTRERLPYGILNIADPYQGFPPDDWEPGQPIPPPPL